MNRVYAAVSILAGAVGLSALVGVVLSLLNAPAAWFTLCFELVVLLASIFGVLASRTRRAEAPEELPITLLCVAGAVGVGSVLGWVGSGHQLMGVSMTLPLAVRLLAALVMAMAAAIEVLRHDARNSAGLLLRGVLAAAPALIVAGAIYKGWAHGWIGALPPGAKGAAVFFGGLLLGGMLSAGVHWIIRAFTLAAEAARRKAA